MSKQREILPKVIDYIREADPYCGAVLMGSVRDGHERPDSDIDTVVIVREHDNRWLRDAKIIHDDEDGMKLIQTWIDGVEVFFICWPAESLAASFRSEPYVYYSFADGEILFDPTGVAKVHVAMAKKYFLDNPAIAKAWVEYIARRRRHKLEPAVALEYPEWGQFIDSVIVPMLGSHR